MLACVWWQAKLDSNESGSGTRPTELAKMVGSLQSLHEQFASSTTTSLDILEGVDLVAAHLIHRFTAADDMQEQLQGICRVIMSRADSDLEQFIYDGVLRGRLLLTCLCV